MVRGQHALANTTMQSALPIPRPAIRLADPKFSRKLIPPNARTLHLQHPAAYPFTISRDLNSAAPTFTPAPRFLIRATVEGSQTRSFASTDSNHTSHPRSDDRRRSAVPIRPLVGITSGGLPGKDRKPIPLLPFRASNFTDALVHTIVGIGISEFCNGHVEWNEAERPLLQFSLQELYTWGGTN